MFIHLLPWVSILLGVEERAGTEIEEVQNDDSGSSAATTVVALHLQPVLFDHSVHCMRAP